MPDADRNKEIKRNVTDEANKDQSLCACNQDPFFSLPLEMRPKPKQKKWMLREVICPGCGLNYSTNRETDLCIDCEKKKAHMGVSSSVK